MPRVSVIVPNFNHARFLETRLNSILNQTYQDFEIIYLDDLSSDDSSGVFARFASDPRITSVLNDKNSGNPFRQWNKGIRLAQGKYVWIAESDDYADPGLLSRLVAILDQNSHVGLAYCNSILVAEHGPNQQWTLPPRWQHDFINDGRDECRRHLILNNTIPNASAVVFRREVYEEAGYADENMRFCGDWLMWLKMLTISDVAYLAMPLNYYRRHSGSVSTSMSHSLTFAAERYQVVAYLKRTLELEGQLLEQACDSIMAMWLAFLRSQIGNQSLLGNWEVYEAARAVDPQLNIRLLKKLSRYLVVRLGLNSCIRIARATVDAAVSRRRGVPCSPGDLRFRKNASLGQL